MRDIEESRYRDIEASRLQDTDEERKNGIEPGRLYPFFKIAFQNDALLLPDVFGRRKRVVVFVECAFIAHRSAITFRVAENQGLHAFAGLHLH